MSAANPPPATGDANPPATSGGAPAAQSSGTVPPLNPAGIQTSGTGTQTPSGSVNPPPPNPPRPIPGDPLYTVQYCYDPAWPADLRLDPTLSNWAPWSRRLRLLCKRQGLGTWLEGPFSPPDANADPHAHRVWTINDQSLTAFILQNVCEQDYKDVCDFPTSRVIFAELRERYEKLGPHTQINLIERAARTEFTPDVRLSQTWNELDNIIGQSEAIGPIDHKRLQIACAIKGLGKHYEHLQSTIQSMTNQPGFTIKDIARRIFEEDNLIWNRKEAGLIPTSSALATQAKPRGKTTCSHCKRVGHFAEYCVQPGGKMAGRTVEEAKAAYRASKGRTGNTQASQVTAANVASSTTQTPELTTGTNNLPVVIHGVPYNLVPATYTIPPIPDATMAAYSSARITTVDSGYNFDADHEFHANIAICGAPHVSIDWRGNTRAIDLLDTPISPVAYSANRLPIEGLSESPFFLDTGANAHISPVQSDFKTLRAISPHPISGVGGSYIYAVGIGSININISGGHSLTLENVLFAPASTVRLISVLNLNRSGCYVSHFDESSFWLTNSSGATLLRGVVHENRKLYCLSLTKGRTSHFRDSRNDIANNPKPRGGGNGKRKMTSGWFLLLA